MGCLLADMYHNLYSVLVSSITYAVVLGLRIGSHDLNYDSTFLVGVWCETKMYVPLFCVCLSATNDLCC